MSNAASQKLLITRVGDQRYALSVFAVRDMLHQQPTLPIPLAPAYVTGIFNLRGKLVTALDLRIRLNHGATEPGIMVIVEQEQELTALIVDAVIDVIAARQNEIQKPTKQDHASITGTLHHKDEKIHLLDLTRLIA